MALSGRRSITIADAGIALSLTSASFFTLLRAIVSRKILKFAGLLEV